MHLFRFNRSTFPPTKDRRRAKVQKAEPATGGGHATATRPTAAQLLMQLVTVALFTLLLTVLCRYVLNHVFRLDLNPAYWIRDYLGNLVVALLAWALVQRTGRALILTSILVIGFQMANAGKLTVLGTPVSPDDFLNVQNLFYLTDGWRRIGLMLLAFLPLIAAVLLVPWRRGSAWAVLMTLLGTGVLVNYYSEYLQERLDGHFGNSVWNQPENFRQRGLALHIAQESVRTLAKTGKHPDRDSVLAATEALPQPQPFLLASAGYASLPGLPGVTAEQQKRNVHIIVLESFFDPVTLGSEWVPEDPLPAEFRQLWAETGNSLALSPVFGGYTANAEFETLCGFPVTENAVFFEGWLRREVPCLPSVLAEAGYRTIASHPNVPGFWNRTHAYSLVGFDTYLSKDDFDLEDSIEGLLVDLSFYRQVFDRLDAGDIEEPVFNYMLTYHGHLPYPSSPRYPDQIKAGRDAGLLHAYLNQLWYKSRHLVERVKTIRAEDPDALLVMFGDHLPFLGPNYGVYTEARGLPADRADFTGDMLEYLVSTPLIIIDGRNGPLDVGKLPLYRLPALILDLLGIENEAGMLTWAQNPPGELIRPLYGMHISVQSDMTTACPSEDAASTLCSASASWHARTRVLINDMFTGKQYSLSRLHRASRQRDG